MAAGRALQPAIATQLVRPDHDEATTLRMPHRCPVRCISHQIGLCLSIPAFLEASQPLFLTSERAIGRGQDGATALVQSRTEYDACKALLFRLTG